MTQPLSSRLSSAFAWAAVMTTVFGLGYVSLQPNGDNSMAAEAAMLPQPWSPAQRWGHWAGQTSEHRTQPDTIGAEFTMTADDAHQALQAWVARHRHNVTPGHAEVSGFQLQSEDGAGWADVPVFTEAQPVTSNVVTPSFELVPEKPAAAAQTVGEKPAATEQAGEPRKALPRPPSVSEGDSRYSLVEANEQMRRLRRHIAQRYGVEPRALMSWFKTIEVEAQRYGVDPLLVVAIMAVESKFDPQAQSHQGALGLMQVIPKWHLDKIDARVAGDPEPDHLLDPKINIGVGIEVLAEGLRRYRGDVARALQYYNGNLNDRGKRYARRVLSHYRQFARVAGVSPTPQLAQRRSAGAEGG